MACTWLPWPTSFTGASRHRLANDLHDERGGNVSWISRALGCDLDLEHPPQRDPAREPRNRINPTDVLAQEAPLVIHSPHSPPMHHSSASLTLLLALGLVACAEPPSAPIDGGFRSTPASAYELRTMQGFQVHVATGITTSTAGQAALDLLDAKLAEIDRALPPTALAQVQRVPLWLSIADTVCPAACYHPSSSWLSENGYEPAKSGGVELTNLVTFVQWSKEQPSMVLHELAHGYHHQVLGYGDQRILSAYDALVASKAFESVAYVNGGTRRHYALTSAVEMFAELSETHFGRNDFAPFDRQALTAEQPQLEQLMLDTWK